MDWQPDAARDHLTARLRPGQPDLLERLRLDQRQRTTGPLAVGTEVAVALEPAAGHRRLNRGSGNAGQL